MERVPLLGAERVPLPYTFSLSAPAKLSAPECMGGAIHSRCSVNMYAMMSLSAALS
jgi:hypothetical protein